MSRESTAPDLATLLERGAHGDKHAFAEFYDATVEDVYGVAVRVIRNPTLAEEVAQDAYLEAWRWAGRYDRRRGTPQSWLLTIVRRRAVDRIRATEAALRREATYVRRETPSGEVDTTSDTVHASLEAQRVRAALADLTALQRRAIGLAYYGGLTYKEVAAVLGTPPGTVKSRIRDGLIRLRVALVALPAGAVDGASADSESAGLHR